MNNSIKQLLTLVAIVLLATGSMLAQQAFGGLALYTVREDMSKDPMNVLREVANDGYAYVEAAGYKDGMYYGMKPEDFKKSLEEVGLKPMSTHQPTVTFENADQLIADAKAAGFKYFVIPVPPKGHFTRDAETGKRHMDGDLDLLVQMLDAVGKKGGRNHLVLVPLHARTVPGESHLLPVRYIQYGVARNASVRHCRFFPEISACKFDADGGDFLLNKRCTKPVRFVRGSPYIG